MMSGPLKTPSRVICLMAVTRTGADGVSIQTIAATTMNRAAPTHDARRFVLVA